MSDERNRIQQIEDITVKVVNNPNDPHDEDIQQLGHLLDVATSNRSDHPRYGGDRVPIDPDDASKLGADYLRRIGGT